jgi:hypothetical protein
MDREPRKLANLVPVASAPAPTCHERLKGLKFAPLETAAQCGWGLEA